MGRSRSEDLARDPATGKPLPSGVYYLSEGVYRARKLVDGKRINKNFKTAREAGNFVKAIEVDASRNQFVDTRALKDMNFGQLVSLYLRDKTPLKRGADREEYVLNAFLGQGNPRGKDKENTPSFLASIKLSNLMPRNFAKWRDDHLDQGLSSATVVRTLNLFASIIEFGRHSHQLPFRDNPASARATPRPADSDRARIRRFLPSEEERLFVELTKEPGHIYNVYNVTKFAIETGARQGEILSIEWRDVDFEKLTIMIRGISGRGTKNGLVRKIPMYPVTHQISRHASDIE